MKSDQISTIQDAQLFCEGVINDFDAGILGKDEVMKELEIYTKRVRAIRVEEVKQLLDEARKDERAEVIEKARAYWVRFRTLKNFVKAFHEYLNSLKQGGEQ